MLNIPFINTLASFLWFITSFFNMMNPNHIIGFISFLGYMLWPIIDRRLRP